MLYDIHELFDCAMCYFPPLTFCGRKYCYQMDRYRSCEIRLYHFDLLQTGAMRREGDNYIYTGLCNMVVELHCDGSVLHFPQFRVAREVSWTLPPDIQDIPGVPVVPVAPVVPMVPVASTVPAASSVPSVGQSSADLASPEGPCAHVVPSSLGKRKRSSTDSEEAILAEDVAGPSHHRSMWDDEGCETDPEEETCSYPESAEAVAVECPDDCVEVVNIEDSVEVVDLTSDSEPSDPSEGSYTPASP